MPDRPTIFALSSGRPPVAIAVIRISGPRAGAALTTLGVKIPAPRKAGLARIRDPRSGEIIDEALVLWFPAPHSETGEDVAELQAHGGRAVIAAILDALAQIDGLRMAEAGEFTRRGFENGKLDLTAVEGLADLVGAETEGQRRQAFRQMKGLLGNRAETWRKRLIQALALVEARIDFSDEADVPEDLVAPALAIARELKAEIAAALADGHRGERLREGLVVAIAGPPNAGKSTLLNRIARREAAIVSPYAGTTRDVVEVHLDLGGLPVTLLDTAGIRDTDDPVELEGVRRARERAASADLVLWVVDASAAEAAAGLEAAGGAAGRNQPAAAGSHSIEGEGPLGRPNRVWLVRNKIDLLKQGLSRSEPDISGDCKSEREISINKPLIDIVDIGLTHKNEPGLRFNEGLRGVINVSLLSKAEEAFSINDYTFNLSADSGEGFDALLAQLRRHAEDYLSGGEQSLVSRARHRTALEATLAALQRAEAVANAEDFLAEELRTAAHALGRLTGRVDVEDVLDVIFRDFCIGK
ncbi:MAG: tRNA uridine-5-carboxymethylaminomethyl(34) synthesis GTPase MnmE [Pseudolabrys sp.]|nr:tRNA uridine-5-carboxymethylaminomethyl(34) synthesis GTPase MnmE [Pseudolabrys sp.]